jgi:hypothetical protein
LLVILSGKIKVNSEITGQIDTIRKKIREEVWGGGSKINQYFIIAENPILAAS